tara:strand:+ start:1398 stop:1772 length:375 start_codon:yes stop_codon:yes gene_type:complete
MATLSISLSNQKLNHSVQTSDYLYYLSVSTNPPTNPWKVQSSTTRLIGMIKSITSSDPFTHVIDCEVDPATIIMPQPGDFLTFKKNNTANTSSLLGYYAEVSFHNNSKSPAELYSIGSNVSISS